MMKMRKLAALAGAAALALAPARAASAQAPDTAGVVRAVGTLLVDSMVPYLGDRNPNFVLVPTTAFDSAVAAILDVAPGMKMAHPGRSGDAEWVGTHGFVMRGDTAAVLVEFGTYTHGAGPIDTYQEENWYLFVPGPGGWRFVRREFRRGTDSGPVRG